MKMVIAIVFSDVEIIMCKHDNLNVLSVVLNFILFIFFILFCFILLNVKSEKL